MDKQTKFILLIILVIIILFFLTKHNENLELEDGEKCILPGDCKSGKCKENGTCGYVDNGVQCANDSECRSRLCNLVTKTCTDKLQDTEQCVRDAECNSGLCLKTGDSSVCHQPFEDYSDCQRDDECKNKSCINKQCQQKIVDNSDQQCKVDNECQSNVCNFVNHTCGLSDNNIKCNRHKECKSGYCKSGVCMNRPQN